MTNPTTTPALSIDASGFSLTFRNGVTVSVRIGPHHYCQSTAVPGGRISDNAEVAILRNGDFIPFDHGDVVEGYRNIDEIFALIAQARNIP